MKGRRAGTNVPARLNIIKMKKRLFSVLLVLIMSLSLLSTVYAESPPTIKVPDGYEIVAQYGSGYTYTANGNEEELLFDTYIVRVPTDTTVIANVIPGFDISVFHTDFRQFWRTEFKSGFFTGNDSYSNGIWYGVLYGSRTV